MDGIGQRKVTEIEASDFLAVSKDSLQSVRSNCIGPQNQPISRAMLVQRHE